MTESYKIIRPPPGLTSPYDNGASTYLTRTPSPSIYNGPTVQRPIKIALEGIPCNKMFQLLEKIKNSGLPVFNRSRTWMKLYNNNPEENRFAYFMHQMIENAAKTVNQNGFCLYYNLYSLQSIWFDFLNKNHYVTGAQDQILRNSASYLLEPPDYIIYFFNSTDDLLHDGLNKAYNHNQIKQIYEDYEWVLDNTHCPYPLFKVNLQESIEHIFHTIRKILVQIHERIELAVDVVSD